jgi:hypothetical protein
VFIGLGDICGYYSQLERGFTELGVPCVFVNAYPERDYGRSSRAHLIGRVVEWIAARRMAAARGSLARSCLAGLQGMALVPLLVHALFSFDVFIFSGGTTFLFLRDLPLLKLFRKKVVMVFHGSDSRPPFLNAAIVGTEGRVDVESCAREARAIKARIRTVERFADYVVNHSMNAHFHQKAIINWLHIGIPYDSAAATAGPRIKDDAAVVVHAPTRPGPKGTARIEAAIGSLERKGLNIRLVKIVGRPPADVLQALAGCDFVVDELFSDTPMASFATEAAVLGKPAVVGMYGYDKLLRYTGDGGIPPVLVCLPDDVEAAVEKLVIDPRYRAELGAAARRFVEQEWSPRLVAARFLRLVNGDIPAAWWFDPAAIDYLHGWGLTDERVRDVLRQIISAQGTGALQLADKPHLERAFCEFAAAAPEPRLSC